MLFQPDYLCERKYFPYSRKNVRVARTVGQTNLKYINIGGVYHITLSMLGNMCKS